VKERLSLSTKDTATEANGKASKLTVGAAENSIVNMSDRKKGQ
jgi:hypothetical protein